MTILNTETYYNQFISSAIITEEIYCSSREKFDAFEGEKETDEKDSIHKEDKGLQRRQATPQTHSHSHSHSLLILEKDREDATTSWSLQEMILPFAV